MYADERVYVQKTALLLEVLAGCTKLYKMYDLELQICVTGCPQTRSLLHLPGADFPLRILASPVYPTMQYQTPKPPYAVQGREGAPT